MIEKIFAAIESIKRNGQITQACISEAVSKIVKETNVHGQPSEAYAILEYIKNVAEESQKQIHGQTLKHIIDTGEDIAMGVIFQAEVSTEHSFPEDKQWVEINRKYMIHKDALDLRETFLKNLVKDAIKNNLTSPIHYIKKTSLKPTFLN